MPFDARLTTKISPLIEGQVPDFIQSDHPQFVQFLKQYYQFLEAAELIVDGTVDNMILEHTDTQYIRNEDSNKFVTESGTGTTGKFTEGEIITGGTSKATATILVDDLNATIARLFISSNQKFEIGETITGGTSGAIGTIVSYRANPVSTIQQLLDYANTDNTTAAVLDEMFNQFMAAIPKTLASGVSKRNLIKNIKDLYTAKGTSEGHKLFLRMLFAEEADIFYPNKYMIRTSDGKWRKKTVIRCENQSGAEGGDVIGQIITGVTSGATCFVIDAIVFVQGASSITEFQIDIDSTVGTFIEGETVTGEGVTSKVEMKFTIQKIVAGSIVSNSGILYSSGETIDLDASAGNDAAVVQVGEISLGGLKEIVVDTVGSNYKVGDVLTFTTTEANTNPAEGFVSVVGGSTLLEDSDNSDGYDDFIILQSATNKSLPLANLLFEDDDAMVLNGTDGSATDAGYAVNAEYGTQRDRILDYYGTGADRIVFEEGTPSTAGEITRVFLTNKGGGYSDLPTVGVTSTFGTSTKLIATTDDIGGILSTTTIDSGFNYRNTPATDIPAKFVLKNVTGTFAKSNTLTTHTGTIAAWDATKQILSTTVEDVVRVQMEQDSATVSQQIQLEKNTEATLSSLLANNVMEGNDLQYLLTQGLDEKDATKIQTEDGFDTLVTDAEGSFLQQINVQHDRSLSDERIKLEENKITSDDYTENDSETQHFVLDSNPTCNLVLDATAVGDGILLNATDGSSTDAGDEVLLDRTDAGGSDAGDKVIQQSKNEGDNLLYEPYRAIQNRQQHKDKFQLNGSSIQRHTLGGWVDTDRVDNESLQTAASQTIFTPATEGGEFLLERFEGEGYNEDIRLEVGTGSEPVNGFELEIQTTVVGDGILLNGTDGSSTDAGDEVLLNGTDALSTDVGDKLILETGPGVLLLDGTDGSSTDAGDELEQEIAIMGHLELLDSNLGDAGLLLLDGTDSGSTDAGDNLVGESDLTAVGERTGGYGERLVLDAFENKYIFRETSLNTFVGGLSGEDDILKLEGNPASITFAPHDLSRTVDNEDGILLEDALAAVTVNTKEFLILEGIDGNGHIGSGNFASADAAGFYYTYENLQVSHANDSTGRIISEAGEPLLNEESILGGRILTGDNKRGGDNRLILNNNILEGGGDDLYIVLNGTDSDSANAGDNIIFDGFSAADSGRDNIRQESGAIAGQEDSRLGDDLLIEDESMLAGVILLDATDDDETDSGFNIINEDGISFIGNTITDSSGATGTIVGASIPKLTILNDFIATEDGAYTSTDSLISEDIVRIQDSYYYQDFSYEVRIGQSVSAYINELKRAVHPAGFVPFGKVRMVSLISAAIQTAGAGRADFPDITPFSPILASALETIFSLYIKKRIGIPHTYREGSYFEELRLETGVIPLTTLVLDGTNYGTELETATSAGVIDLENLANDGDNILITASDDGSQVDAGDNVILDGTDADGTDDGDVTGTYGNILLDGSEVTEAWTGSETIVTIHDEGSAILLSGSALGVYELVDASDNSLVLNGTDDFPTGRRNRIVHEDGDSVGDNIITDRFAVETITTETGGPITVESSIPLRRGPYIYMEAGERIVSEDFVVVVSDAAIINLNLNIGLEESLGDRFTLEDDVGVLMSEASAGTQGDGFDVNFIRLLKTKITIPRPDPLNSVGLTHMVLNTFGTHIGVDSIQLEDGTRKRGPTVNADRLILNGIDVGRKDDPDDIKHGGEAVDLEDESSINLGIGVKFEDFYRFAPNTILLNGTDSSSTNAGSYIASESASHGKILGESSLLGLPFNDFLRPDIMVMEQLENKPSDEVMLLLEGTDSSGSNGGDRVILNGTDSSSTNAGDYVGIQFGLFEINKSRDDRNDVGILIEQSESGGTLALELDNISYTLLEDNSGNVILNGTDSSSTNAGNIVLQEIDEGTGHDILLEKGSGSGLGYKIILEAARIEIESGINDGEIPSTNLGDNSIFPTLTRPTEIKTHPVGHVVLQDERSITKQQQEGDSGEFLVLDGTDQVGAIALNGTNGSSANENSVFILDGTDSTSHDVGDQIVHEDAVLVDSVGNLLMDETILDHHHQGHVLLNGTDGSATNAGSRVSWDDGTFESLIGSYAAFIPPGGAAETYDALRTTFDNTSQTYDVLEGA